MGKLSILLSAKELDSSSFTRFWLLFYQAFIVAFNHWADDSRQLGRNHTGENSIFLSFSKTSERRKAHQGNMKYGPRENKCYIDLSIPWNPNQSVVYLSTPFVHVTNKF